MAECDLVFAVKENEWVRINEVESGLACGCVCPVCGGKLIARKGEHKRHHFAHHNAEACSYNNETALHLMAKTIIAKVTSIMLPPVFFLTTLRKSMSLMVWLCQRQRVFQLTM